VFHWYFMKNLWFIPWLKDSVLVVKHLHLTSSNSSYGRLCDVYSCSPFNWYHWLFQLVSIYSSCIYSYFAFICMYHLQLTLVLHTYIWFVVCLYLNGLIFLKHKVVNAKLTSNRIYLQAYALYFIIGIKIQNLVVLHLVP